MKRFISLILITVTAASISWAEYPEKITIYGTISDYSWALSANKLAVLFTDRNENQFIYIFSTGPLAVEQKIYIHDSYDPREIAWLQGGTTLVFSHRNGNVDDILQLSLQEEEISPYMPEEPRIGYIRDLQISTSGLWSITWEVENTIDVFFYKENRLVSSTHTNGSFIESIAWKDDALYVRSNLSEASFFNGGGSESTIRPRIYAINPYTEKSHISDMSAKELTNNSFDSSYYLNIIQDPYINAFELWLY